VTKGVAVERRWFDDADSAAVYALDKMRSYKIL
jgi:hypothetical protein